MKLRDDQWKKLEPLLIGTPGDPGANGHNNRLFIEAMLWIASNNRSWQDLPAQFGKSSTAYMRFRRWNQSGFWRHLLQSQSDDVGLSQILGLIASYDDQYTKRAEQRLTRRGRVITPKPASNPDQPVQSVDDLPVSTERQLHWVGLVDERWSNIEIC
jgi:transposase